MSVIQNPWEKSTGSGVSSSSDLQSENKGLAIASLPDRAAATFVDGLILAIIVGVIVAPFRKQLLYSILNEDVTSYVENFSIIICICLVSFFAYQTLFVFFKGATVGKMIFKIRVVNLWSADTPRLADAFLRSFAWLLSALPLGLPFLEIFSNPQRRSLHDRINDTVVVSVGKRIGYAPTLRERLVVRSVYSFFVSLLVVIVVSQITRVQQEFSSMNDFMGVFGDSSFVCEDVSDAQSAWPKKNGARENRLVVALSLFATDLIDEECLDVEARRAFYFKEDMGHAYLAKAFATSNEPALSDHYLKKVCELDPDSESCDLTKIIVLWTEKKWQEASEEFKKLESNTNPILKIWAIKHFEKNKKYEEELKALAGLWPNAVLKGYIGTHRTIALWGAHRIEEARQSFLGTYDSVSAEQREAFSGWMCDLETEESCSANNKSTSCDIFVGQLDTTELTQTSSALTYIKTLSCKSDFAQSLSSLKYRTQDPNLRLFIKALYAKEIKNKGESRELFRKLLPEVEDDPQFDYEVRSQLLTMTPNNEEIATYFEDWKSAESKNWYWIRLGNKFASKFYEMRDYNKVAEAGDLLIELDPQSLSLKHKLLVSYYKTGDFSKAHAMLNNIHSENNKLEGGRAIASKDDWEEIELKIKSKLSSQPSKLINNSANDLKSDSKDSQ